jgi:hypothetical protein
MSTSAAMATVTATLQHLLSNVAPGATVTTQPPSLARNGESGEQLNIFLYSTHYDAAFRNSPLPAETRNGEHGYPPLPLVLKYLITSYGLNEDDISGQQLMGQAMSLLHDHPLLGRSDIIGITPDSNLHEQIERIRITPDTLSLDDMSKLWTTFQSAEYRLSTGYEASVVLIESTRTRRAPLPVLKRGEGDSGPDVVAAPASSLSGLRFPDQKPSAEIGDEVTIFGERLSRNDTKARFRHAQQPAPIDIELNAGAYDNELTLRLPALADDPEVGAKWPAGFYALSLVTERVDTPTWVSNSISMPLSPTVLSISPASAAAGDVSITLECLPQIRTGQRVALLFGDRTIEPDSITTPSDPTASTTIDFTVTNAIASATPYVLRLRVDGVDSIPVDFSGDAPQFADDQKVTIT